MNIKEHVKQLKVTDVVPNPWNPNHMADGVFKKLKKNIKITLKKAGIVPPIVVRVHKEDSTKYEILDGEHRWRAFNDLKQETIPALILKDLDESEAKLLTLNLNYLKGEYEEAEYTNVLRDIIRDSGCDIEELSSRVNTSTNDIASLLERFSFNLDEDEEKDLDKLINDINSNKEYDVDSEADSTNEKYFELVFMVPEDVLTTVNSELSRLQNMQIDKGEAPILYKALLLMAKRSKYLGDVDINMVE